MRAVGLAFAIACFAGLCVWIAWKAWAPAAAIQRSAGHLMPDEPLHAAAYRYLQRLSEDGTVPENAFVKAKAQRDAMGSRGDAYGGVFPASWTWLGPGNIGGRIRPIVIDPGNPNVIYVGAASGGIWKTTNGGSSWQPLDDFIPGLAVSSMAMHPGNPNVLYAGTGEGFAEWPDGTSNTAFVRGAGIFKTTDAGATWVQIPSTANPDFYAVNRLAIQPGNPNVMLAATTTGIFRSLDGGQSWSRTFTGYVYDVKYSPTDGSKAIAGLHDDGALFSTDGGASWSPATGAAGHRTELCYYQGDPNIVYAAISNADRIKIYRSMDGGQSYALQTSGNGVSTYAAYNNTVWVDPTNPNTVVFGGVWLYRSTNGGVSFSQVFSSVHADMHAIVHHPGYNGSSNRTVYFATDGGIYRTLDVYGSSATALNNNLGITQFYGAVMNPISGVVFGGTQDNGTLRYTGNIQGWTRSFGGDGGIAATDPTDSNYFYGEIQWGQVFRSTNGGASASYIYSGITDAGGSLTNFITPLLLDPNNPNRLLVGCRRLWRTNNAKGSPPSWTAIKPTIEPTGRPERVKPPNAHMLGNSPFNISAIWVAEGNPDLIYVGHNNGQIWKTTNGTAGTPSWTRVDDGDGPMPLRWVSQLFVDPNNHDRVYATFMGWEPDNVWRSLDGGATWTEITGTGAYKLPSMPVSAFTKHRTEPGWLYIGTDLGIFVSVDDGQTWSPENQGPGLVPVEELRWRNNDTLIAVTHGRGIYQATVTPQADPVSPSAFRVIIGNLRQGPLPWLFFSDDRRVIVDTDLSSGDFVFPVLVELKGVLAFANPSELRFTLESSVSALGQGQQIMFFNRETQRFDVVDTRNATVSDSTVQVSVAANAARYVDPSTREVRVRIGYFPSASELAGNWSARMDQAYWTAIR